jgi:AraC family transcriptional regulator
MDYRIVEQPSFKVIGKTIRVSTHHGENQRRIPQFWDECDADGTLQQLEALAGAADVLRGVILGICMDFAADMSEFTYMCAAETSGEEVVPDGMVRRSIPAAAWAVFEGRGALPEAIQTLWGRIWSEFFKDAQFKHGDGPDLELYPKGDHSQPGYQFELRIPVVPK